MSDQDTHEAGYAAHGIDRKKITLKLLASHVGAGALIGKSGASISEIQSASEATIQISRVNELFPGTTDRVMQVSGEMLKVMSALHLIMQKWQDENVFKDHMDLQPDEVQLKIVTLGKLCGAVIGEGGKTIQEIKLATNTDVRVQSRDAAFPGVNERIITITGELNSVLTAVGRVLNRFLEDPAFETYTAQPINSASLIPSMQNMRVGRSDDALQSVDCSFSLMLSNEQAGAVLGVRGSNISEILKVSHAHVSVQNRTEVADGEPRRLTIEGPLDSCASALGMVMAKIRETVRSQRGSAPPRDAPRA